MNIIAKIFYTIFPQAKTQIEYPRVNSIVRIIPGFEYETDQSIKSSFFKEGHYMYLGEIVNMPGHGIFIGMKTNNVYTGYHIDEFEEIPEEEI